MARQEENYHAQAQAVAWEYLIGHSVEDENGEKIGTVKALWEDFTRQPAYLGIATSWLDMGRIHVVPAHYATVSERKQCIRLPFSSEIVKHAPECHASDEITLRGETKIRDYFRRQGIATDFNAELSTPKSTGRSSRPESGQGHPLAEPDWSPQAREKEHEKSALRRELDETVEEEPEMNDRRSLRERISDAVEQGKAEFKKDRDEDRPGYLRKIYHDHDQPVAEPVLPREENRDVSESIRREKDEDSFVPLRREAMDAERRRLRRENDREDLPLH